MSSLFAFDFIRKQLHRRSLRKKIALARTWPTATGEVNHWVVKQAEDEELSGATPCQVEARFHFSINGEYYGGYFRSVCMGQHAAETAAQGTPAISVRYDPANPNSAMVLPEDNETKLSFRISSN